MKEKLPQDVEQCQPYPSSNGDLVPENQEEGLVSFKAAGKC